MEAGEPTVFVVDDDDAVRASLHRLLAGAGLRVESFPSAEAFLAACDESRRGCVVMDVRMPGMSGLEAQETMKVEQITMPVIMLSGHATIAAAVRATRAGAMEFLEKPFDPKVLVERVREALRRDQLAHTEAQDRELVTSVIRSLTPNEREVLSRLVRGQTVEQVARELGLSIGAVHHQRDTLTRQMGPRGFATLTRLIGQGMTIHTLGS